ADIENEISGELGELGRRLQALNPGRDPASGDSVQQVAQTASELREQLEEMQRQALALQNGNGQPGSADANGDDSAGQSPASIAEMRERLAQAQQLSRDLADGLQDQQSQQQAARQPGQGQQGQQG